jgi:predicted transcriptional regulator
MTPDEYRAKWGLKRDYPMVAPNYSEARSGLAKSLGSAGRQGEMPAGSAEVVDTPAERRRLRRGAGRRPKAAA